MFGYDLFVMFCLRFISGTDNTDDKILIHFANNQALKFPMTHKVFEYFEFFKTKLERHNKNYEIDLKKHKIETFENIYKPFNEKTDSKQEFENNVRNISFVEFQDILYMIDYLDLVKITGYDSNINSLYKHLGEILVESLSDESFELTAEKIDQLLYDQDLLTSIFEQALITHDLRISKNFKNFTITDGLYWGIHSDIYVFLNYKDQDLHNSHPEIMKLISWFGKALNLSEIILLDVFTNVNIILFDKINFDNLSTEVFELCNLMEDLKLEYNFKKLAIKDRSFSSDDYCKISSLNACESIRINNKQSGIENMCYIRKLNNITIVNSTFDIKDLLFALEQNFIRKLSLKSCNLHNLGNLKIEDICKMNIITLESVIIEDCEMNKIENLINELIKKQKDLDKFSIIKCNFRYLNEEKVSTSYYNGRVVNVHESDFLNNLLANLKDCLKLSSLTIIGILSDSIELNKIKRFKNLNYLCLSVYEPESYFYNWFCFSSLQFLNLCGDINQNEIKKTTTRSFGNF